MGVWAEGARQKFGNPYLFLQPVKLTISNLIYNLSLGSTLPRTFTMKINRGPRLGKHPKIWDTLFISATVEASNFKFGIQLRLAEELAKKQLLRPKLAGVRAKGASKKLGLLFVYETVEASKFKLAGLQEQLKKCGYHVYSESRTLYQLTATEM